MPIADIAQGVPSQADRFAVAVERYEKSLFSTDPAIVARARDDLALVAWNLSHAIVDAMRAVERRGPAGRG